MLSEILFATGNKNKYKEFSELVSPYKINVLSLSGYGLKEPEETGKTFQENSILKAKYYGDSTGKSALADDSGMCVEALNGAPGIYSARWAGDTKDFNLAIKKIEEEINKTDSCNYNANFTCNLSLYIPKVEKFYSFEGVVNGKLTFPARGEHGFGYDPIFIPEGYDLTFAELGSSVKQKISHRAKAFEKFISWIKENEKF